jgi:hypothetical protein
MAVLFLLMDRICIVPCCGTSVVIRRNIVFPYLMVPQSLVPLLLRRFECFGPVKIQECDLVTANSKPQAHDLPLLC